MTITAGNFLPLGLWKETVKGSMIIMINWCNEHINRRPMDHRSTHWHFCWRPSFPWNSSAPQAALYQLDQRHLQIACLMQLTKHWCWGVNSDAADHVKSSYRLLPVSPCRHQQHLKLWTILKRNRHYCSDCCNFLNWFRQSHPKLRQPIRSWLAQKMAFNTILTNAGILFIAPLGTKLSEIQMKIQQLSHKKINFVCKMAVFVSASVWQLALTEWVHGRSTLDVMHFTLMGNWTQNINSRIVHLDKKYLYFDLNVNDIYSQGPISVT